MKLAAQWALLVCAPLATWLVLIAPVWRT